MKKILVTGNVGYIGSTLTSMLMKSGQHEVDGLDIAFPPIIDVHNQHQIDIRKLFNVDKEYDCVIHLAALVNVGESEKHPISYYITNLNGTMNVLNKIKTKNFIFASTGAADVCTSAYGISKRAAEDVVREFCDNYDKKDFTIFRFYNVIGAPVVYPTNQDALMFNLLKAKETGEFTIFGNDYNTPDGTCIRDYVHVTEICNALIEAIEKPSTNIECLGTGEGYSVKEIVEIFQRVNDVTFEVKYGPRRKGDIETSVLQNVSPYMKSLFTIEKLLKV